MSRMSVKAFLSKAKQALSRSIQSNGEIPVSFVIGNESADLDSIACAVVYGFIQSSTQAARKADKCIIPVTNIHERELRLRPELTALLKHANLKPSDLITLDDVGDLQDRIPASQTEWILVDHNVLQGPLGEHFSKRVIGAIDHHDDEGRVPKDAKPRIIEKTGSCNSHVVNYCRDTWDSVSSVASTSGAAHGQGDGALDDAAYTTTWDAQVAKLALGAILIDTFNMRSKDKVTEHDKKAVKYLEAKINVSPAVGKKYDRDDFFKEINDAKSDLDHLNVREILEKDYKEWTEGDLKVGISCCVRSVSYIQHKEEDILPVLLKFAKDRKLDICGLMTAHNDGDFFQRQLLLMAVKDGRAVEAVERFAATNAKELQLRDSETKIDGKGVKWFKLWEQGNLSASRKKVAPMVREAMK